MNILEQKATLLQQTPQVMWFQARYRPMGMYLMDLMKRGIISQIAPLEQLGLPSNFKGMIFEFESIMYLWAFEVEDSVNGPIIQCCHLESLVEKWDNILNGHILLTSDDDSHQQTFFSLLFLIAKKQTKIAFKDWVRSKYINVSDLI